LIAGAVHETSLLLPFPRPPSCFPGPAERRMSEVCQLGPPPQLHGDRRRNFVNIFYLDYACRELDLLLFIQLEKLFSRSCGVMKRAMMLVEPPEVAQFYSLCNAENQCRKPREKIPTHSHFRLLLNHHCN